MTTTEQLQLAEVWRELVPQLERLVRAMRLDGPTGEDVLQDVYVQAMQKRPPGVSDEHLRSWLYRVTVNRCNLVFRQSATQQSLRRRSVEQRPAAQHAPDVAQQHQQREAIGLVRQQMMDMPTPLYTVLVLRYFVELDSREIAAILEIPDSTVRSRLRQARLQLAGSLKSRGYEHDS